jgi:hypothetical protein
MADDIVQTIKIEVEGADQAASEIKKVGQAAEEVQATAASTAGGTQELGKGLDQVSQKSGVSSRELRSLGKIMKEMGAGEIAGTAIGFARIAMVLGPLGVAAFAVAEAFAFVRGKMKEAEDQAKSVVETFSRIAKISAEMHPEGGWGATAAGVKEVANSVDIVADKLESIRKGAKETISALTSPETLGKAFVRNLEDVGVSVNDLAADTTKLGAAWQQAGRLAAQTFEKLSPIGKAEFAKGLKTLGFTEDQIKNLEKGPAALEKATAAANRNKQALDALSQSWDKINKAFAASSFAPPPVEDLGAGLANFISVLQKVGEVEHAIIDPIIAAFQAIPGVINASIAQVNASIQAWVTTPVANAWQWLKDSFQAALDWMAEKAAAFISNVKSIFTGTGAPAGAAGGQVGGSAGFAGGGLLGGRGSGTSDSNLAWVSRGEHIMPARAVSQPGVLALLEALRLSGGNLRGVLNSMGHFALGGMVRAPLSIPAFAGGGMHNVTIAFPGLPDITGLRASSSVVDELRNAAAMAQVRSGGRKPSRYS